MKYRSIFKKNYPLIFKNLLKRSYLFFLFNILSIGYNQKKYFSEQEITFRKLGLDIDLGKSKLDNYLKEFNVKKPSSWHWLLAASISESDREIKKVLEIGTHSGRFAHFLANIFNDAEIHTIELPEDHPIYLSSYNRSEGESLDQYSKKREKLLNSCENIIFKRENSINLTFLKERYDFIWIDGAHGYPVVPIDIANALRLSSPNGIVAIDDVKRNNVLFETELYSSVATWNTIKTFISDTNINCHLIYKRINTPRANDLIKKYIAILVK